jgi:arylesterase/paraoxonase
MARLRVVPRPSKLLILTTFVLLLVFVPAVWLMWAGGVFRVVDYGFAGSCDSIDMPGITRDIVLDRERGIAYLSVHDRDTGNGTVMLLDLNLAHPAPRAAMSRDPERFRPEGLSLLQQAGQPVRLFAVSGGDMPGIEIADRDAGGAFVPSMTLHDIALGRPTLVAAMSPRSFFVVDHRESEVGLRRKLGLMLGQGHDSIMYSNGAKTVGVVEGLAGVSGLASSTRQSHVYVAEQRTKRLLIYGRVVGQLKLERTVALGSAPGSLAVDAENVIWMTAHPKLLRYFAALDGATDPVPTQVLRFDPRLPDTKPEQVFADDGSMISAGAAVARWRDRLLIAAAFDKKVLICKTVP